MTAERTLWGLHMAWDEGNAPTGSSDIAIGWHEIGSLSQITPTRDAFKAAYAATFSSEKPGAIPVKAGVLYRFANEINIGDVVIHPSKTDRLVNIGIIAGPYRHEPQTSLNHPHRRKVDWKVHLPRANFSQAALYEIGSAVTLFSVSANADEFLAALDGRAFETSDVDDVSAQSVASQVEESVEDFVIKQLYAANPFEFESFIAALLRCMGYHARVTQQSTDGGVDVIAHKDELGFEPPIIKVQCKRTLSTIGGPDVQRLVGATQPNESALFVTLGDYSTEASRIERMRSNLRLLSGSDLVQLVFQHYEKLEPNFKILIPLRRSYSPSPGAARQSD